MRNIRGQIILFNEMYRIPTILNDVNSELVRINDFRDIFIEEIKEVEDIIKQTSTMNRMASLLDWVGDLMVYCLSECERWEFDAMTHTFGALFYLEKVSKAEKKKITYPFDQLLINFSIELNNELKRPLRTSPKLLMREVLFDLMLKIYNFSYGLHISMHDILEIIMESNFSKLDENGKPIFDDRGKLLKGPNFTPPEPELERYLKLNWGV